METHVKDKMKAAEELLQQLQRQEKALTSSIRTHSEQKKLTVF